MYSSIFLGKVSAAGVPSDGPIISPLSAIAAGLERTAVLLQSELGPPAPASLLWLLRPLYMRVRATQRA